MSTLQAEALATARRIGTEVAGVHAVEVDQAARFPKETIDALRAEGLLGALVPADLGGRDDDLRDVAATVRELARHCASSAMVLAMHHIMVACLVRHRRTPGLETFLRRLVDEQLLLASATTEIGIGGDVRSSTCAVVPGDAPGTVRLVKKAPVISYGEHADAILVTARRSPDSPASDQVMVVAETRTVDLEPLSDWDTFGFRGTCSRGFTLTTTCPEEMVCPESFGEISATTMLPVSHLLWSSLWLGLADEACARAQRFVQQAARRAPGTTPPGATRLAELLVVRQQLAAPISALMERFLDHRDDVDHLGSVDFVVSVNALKVSSSTLVVDVINRAMLICGIAGYREDSPFSLGRLLRDAHGAAVMVNNDRIIGNSAQLALAQRGEWS